MDCHRSACCYRRCPSRRSRSNRRSPETSANRRSGPARPRRRSGHYNPRATSRWPMSTQTHSIRCYVREPWGWERFHIHRRQTTTSRNFRSGHIFREWLTSAFRSAPKTFVEKALSAHYERRALNTRNGAPNVSAPPGWWWPPPATSRRRWACRCAARSRRAASPSSSCCAACPRTRRRWATAATSRRLAPEIRW